jgi:hypothetical protein
MEYFGSLNRDKLTNKLIIIGLKMGLIFQTNLEINKYNGIFWVFK